MRAVAWPETFPQSTLVRLASKHLGFRYLRGLDFSLTRLPLDTPTPPPPRCRTHPQVQSNYSVFKEGVKPMWEDEANKKVYHLSDTRLKFGRVLGIPTPTLCNKPTTCQHPHRVDRLLIAFRLANPRIVCFFFFLLNLADVPSSLLCRRGASSC